MRTRTQDTTRHVKALPPGPSVRAYACTCMRMHTRARISAKNDPCVHPFQKWTLRAYVFKSLKTNIWIQISETLGFTTKGLQQRTAGTADTVRVQVAWGMVPVDCIPTDRQGLDNGTLWLFYQPGNKTPSFGCSDPNVTSQMWASLHPGYGQPLQP